MQENQTSPFYTSEEAAIYLRMNAKTLKNLRWRGNGPPYRKHGGKAIYHIDDLNRWSRSTECGKLPEKERNHG